MRVQIVIPCYNEQGRLEVAAFEKFLAHTEEIGIVFVNDGSQDGTSAELHELAARFPARIVVIDQPVNRGKGEAVRVGMLRAMAPGTEYAGYLDADLATPLEATREFIETLDRHPQLQFIIGSRVALLGRSITRKASRHYIGRAFATAASLVLALPVYDTQCGAKLMRVSEQARSLFEKPFGSRWIFDVELFARYLSTYGNREGLYELPLLRWTDVGESKVKWHDFVRAGAEIAAIYRAYGIKRDFNTLLRLTTAPFLRYVGAGGVGTLCHYLLLLLLAGVFAVRPALATVAGATVGASVNYILNYHFTFACNAAHRVTVPRFALVAGISVVLSGVGVWFATTRLGLHYFVAQLGCTAAVLVIGYLVNAAWTFRDRRVAEHETAAGREQLTTGDPRGAPEGARADYLQ
jgi:dolichyl-phosphate beta-glucosyltransferase